MEGRRVRTNRRSNGISEEKRNRWIGAYRSTHLVKEEEEVEEERIRVEGAELV